MLITIFLFCFYFLQPASKFKPPLIICRSFCNDVRKVTSYCRYVWLASGSGQLVQLHVYDCSKEVVWKTGKKATPFPTATPKIRWKYNQMLFFKDSCVFQQVLLYWINCQVCTVSNTRKPKHPIYISKTNVIFIQMLQVEIDKLLRCSSLKTAVS